MDLGSLNEKQVEAVHATEGRIRVIAGAGSGKTRVLAYRYAYLVDEIGIDPANILCVTFTNKAAQEMRARIAGLVSVGNVNDFVCTIHGFCVKFLREEIFRLGYPKSFQILDQEDMKSLAKEVLEENNIRRETMTSEDLLRDFGKWKFPGDYIPDFLLTDSSKDLDNNDKLEVKLLAKQHKYLALDFHDLIYFTLFILDKFSEVRENWQRRMSYVMVDEVQDCTSLEWAIFETMSGMYNNLLVVGDPDQSIYEWRGGNMDSFLKFTSDKDIVLDRNYRSTSVILDAANSIISNNQIRIKKNLYTLNNQGTFITHFHGKNEQEESDWIASQVKRLTESGFKNSDIAVLIRASYLSRSIEQSFIQAGVSYVIWGGVRFFERKEIKDAISYMRLIAFDDDVSFSRIVNVPSRKFGKVSMEKLKKLSEEMGCSLFQALCLYNDSSNIRNDAINSFVSMITDLRDIKQGFKVSDLLDYILKESGLLNLYRDDTEENRLENLNELIQSVRLYESSNREDVISLETYLQDVALYTNADFSKDRNQVKVMTVHQAKGLEFPVVFIAGLSEGIFPNRRSVREMKKRGMEEERRLMYVAVTRAEKMLYLTESEGFSIQGQFNKYPSRFLREIQSQLYVTEGEISEDVWKNADSFRKVIDSEVNSRCGVGSENIVVGSAVVHNHFGEGVVAVVYNDGEYCEVDFDQIGRRFVKKEKLSLKEMIGKEIEEPLDTTSTIIKKLQNEINLFSRKTDIG